MTRDIGVDANINKIRLKQQGSSPSTPSSTYGFLYIKSGGLNFKGDDGVEIGPLVGSLVSDTAYDPTTWDADTTHAPSKNAVRDKIESLSAGTASPASKVYLAENFK